METAVSVSKMLDLLEYIQPQLSHMEECKVAELIRNTTEYRGFKKTRLPTDVLNPLLKSLGLTSEQIRVEIVIVDRDLKDEVHYHRDSRTIMFVLGPNEHFPSLSGNPRVFLENPGEWEPINPCQIIVIPSGERHGFTVDEGGALYFLSIQSPPIQRADGHDDYCRVKLVV